MAKIFRVKIMEDGSVKPRWVWALKVRETASTTVYRLLKPDGDLTHNYFIGQANDILAEKPARLNGKRERLEVI